MQSIEPACGVAKREVRFGVVFSKMTEAARLTAGGSQGVFEIRLHQAT